MASTSTTLRELRLGAESIAWQAVFRRGDSGNLDALSCEWSGKDKRSIKNVLRLLAGLPSTMRLSSPVKIVGIKLTAKELEALRDAGERAGLAVVQGDVKLSKS